MLSNPLTMVGKIDKCWLFTYQTPIDDVKNLLPKNLSLVTYQNFAFWNVVISHIKSMRPKGIPKLFGLDYWHIAYRLYVKFQTSEGKVIEGLYFLHSDCDSSLITMAGNLLTNFNLHPANIFIKENTLDLEINIRSSYTPAKIILQPNIDAKLPAHSAFPSLEEAGSFLKYKPNGIAINPDASANIIHISRREEDWRYRLVDVKTAEWSFFKDKNIKPEVCYQVEPIDYMWNKGKDYKAFT